MKIYRKGTSESYSFLTIDTTLPANDSFKFRKSIIRMAISEELKILNHKIKANQAQYDLHRDAAQVSALSPKELYEDEYLTGKV